MRSSKCYLFWANSPVKCYLFCTNSLCCLGRRSWSSVRLLLARICASNCISNSRRIRCRKSNTSCAATATCSPLAGATPWRRWQRRCQLCTSFVHRVLAPPPPASLLSSGAIISGTACLLVYHIVGRWALECSAGQKKKKIQKGTKV